MLIIKASFVAAILSSLLFWEAYCALAVMIDQTWSGLEHGVWSEAVTFKTEDVEKEVKHPESRADCLFLKYNHDHNHTHVKNVGTIPVIYVLHDHHRGKCTAETKIEPNQMHALMSDYASIYIKKK